MISGAKSVIERTYIKMQIEPVQASTCRGCLMQLWLGIQYSERLG